MWGCVLGRITDAVPGGAVYAVQLAAGGQLQVGGGLGVDDPATRVALGAGLCWLTGAEVPVLLQLALCLVLNDYGDGIQCAVQ